jgi:hypothetical protein
MDAFVTDEAVGYQSNKPLGITVNSFGIRVSAILDFGTRQN